MDEFVNQYEVIINLKQVVTCCTSIFFNPFCLRMGVLRIMDHSLVLLSFSFLMFTNFYLIIELSIPFTYF